MESDELNYLKLCAKLVPGQIIEGTPLHDTKSEERRQYIVVWRPFFQIPGDRPDIIYVRRWYPETSRVDMERYSCFWDFELAMGRFELVDGLSKQIIEDDARSE